MRILLINNLFQPEPNHLKGLAFARELQRRGHHVHVLTIFPNYPGGKLYPGYRMRWTMRETLDGVPVTRAAMYPSHDASATRRILSFLSTGMSQAVHALMMKERFDVCHVYLGPITLMWPARLLRRLHGTRIVADVQDIWPESVADSGMLSSRSALRLLESMSTRAYRAADRLVVPTVSYRELLSSRGFNRDHIEVVYNWCDESPQGSAGGESVLPGILDDRALNVVYAGNLGRLQGLDTVLDAAKITGASGGAVRFLLIGGGVESDRLRDRVHRERIENVRMLPRMPLGQVKPILAKADLLLIHLIRSKLSSISIPQKIQAYLAVGRPILVAVEGEAATLFSKAGAGLTCAPEDPQAMSGAIERFAGLSIADREEMGRRGLQFYRDLMCFTRGVDKLETVLLEAAATRDRQNEGGG
jgi:colanic acid biosynthesis glycosyl transferase WcaI